MPFFNKGQHDPKLFANFYGPMISSIRIARYIAHLISAGAAISAIHRTVNSDLSAILTYSYINLEIFLTIAVVYLLEIGNDKMPTIFFRQLSRWQFRSIWFIGMFVFVLMTMLPFMYFSYSTTTDGADISIRRFMPDPNLHNIDSLRLIQSKDEQKIVDLLIQKERLIQDKWKDDIKAKKREYDSKIAEHKIQVTYHEEREKKGAKWAASHVDKHNGIIKRLRKERSREVDKLEDIKNEELKQFNEHQLTVKDSINTAYNAEVAYLKKDNHQRIKSYHDKADSYSTAGQSMGLFACVLIWVLIAIEQFYRAGSQQDFHQEENKDRDGILYDLWDILILLGNGFRRNTTQWLIYKISPTPPPNVAAAPNSPEGNREDISDRSKPKFETRKETETNTEKPVDSKDTADSAETETKKGKTSDSTETETIITKEEVEARIKEYNRKIQSYKWKIANNVGRKSTAERNINKFKDLIEELKNLSE